MACRHRLQLWLGVVDHLVDDGGSSSRPLFHRHGLVADDVLAHHMFNVLDVTPVLSVAVLQPNKRNVFGVVDNDRLFSFSRHEDLDGIIVIAVGALIERALNAYQSMGDQYRRKRTPAPRAGKPLSSLLPD